MKQLFKASLIVAGLVGVAWAGPVGPPGGPPILNQDFPQSQARYNVSSGTVRDALYIRYLVPGLCHSTDGTGKLISITCGGGGGPGQTTLGVNWNGVNVTSPTVALNAISPIIVTAVSGGTTAQFSLDPSSVTLAGQAIIRLQDTRQVGAVLYIDSGTIINLITQNLVANAASFPNGLTANGTIIGNAQLQMFGLSTFFGPVISANYGYQMPDGSVMTSTTNFAWNGAIPQSAQINITSATIRTQLSLPFLSQGQFATVDAAGHLISVALPASNALAISTGGVIVSSPTKQIDFNGSQFLASLNGTTTQLLLAASSVTLQGNLYSLASFANSIASLGVSTGTLSGSTTTLQNQVTANTAGLVAVGITTGSLQSQMNGKGPGTITGVTPGANIVGGGTSGNVSVALSTGITVASATVTGDAVVTGTATLGGITVPRAAGDPYGAVWYFAEGNLPPGVVGAQTVSADSTTHHLWLNPNNAGWGRLVISSVTSAKTGGLAIWNTTGNLGDLGPPPWVVVPSTFAWTLPYPVIVSSQLIVTGGSTTIVGAATHTGFSTATFSNAFYDYTGSSVAIGFMKGVSGYGNAGDVWTSGGQNSSDTWTTPSAGGGGAGGSPLAVTIGVNRSSPTTDIIFNPNQATGSISGSSITVDISGLRTVGLDTATLKTGLVSVGVDTAAIRSSLNSEITAVGTDTTTLKTGLIAVGVDTASIRSSLNSEITAVGTDTTTLKSNIISVGLDTATLKTGLVAVGVDTASLKTGLVAVGVDTASLKTITVSIGVATNTIGNNYPVSLSTGVVGTLAAAQEPAHTGDVTNAAGSLAMTAAARQSNITTLAASSITATGNMEIDGWTTHVGSVSVTAAGGLGVTYNVNLGSMTGAGLGTCGDSTHGLGFSTTNNLFTCQSITGSGGGGGGSPIAVGTGSATGYTGVITSSPTNLVLYDSSTLTTKFIGGTTVLVSLAGNSLVVTATATIASNTLVTIASCTTRGASPNAWITLTLSAQTRVMEPHRIYNVGADSCSIRIAGNGADLIGSTGTISLDAQGSFADLTGLGNGSWGGNYSATPWSVFTTQDDVGTFTVAVASQVTICPVYIPEPAALMGFRMTRPVASGTNRAVVALLDRNKKFLVQSSSITLLNSGNDYMTGGVTQLAKGYYFAEYTAVNTTMAIGGSNSMSDVKMFCGTAGTSTTGMDLSTFVPSNPLTAAAGTYPAIGLIFNNGLQGY